MSKIELLEEYRKNNFLGDIVGGLMKQLQAFEEKKAKERAKLVKDSSDELLQKFDKALEKVLAPKKDLIAKLRHVYDYHEILQLDAIDLRRRIGAFLDVMDENVLSDGKTPPELMGMQREFIDGMVSSFRNIDGESKEISKATGIEI
jgi:hypothetical protein